MRPLFNKAYSAYDVLLIHADMACSTLRTRLSLAFQGGQVGAGFRSTGAIRIKARAAGDIIIPNNGNASAWKAGRTTKSTTAWNGLRKHGFNF